MNNLKEAFFDLYTRLVEKIHEHRELRDDVADDIDTKSFENGAIYGVQEAINLLKIVKNEWSESNCWTATKDQFPYANDVSDKDWYKNTNTYRPLQIITKDNVLRTAVFLEMKIQDFHGEKLFWLCDVENFHGSYIVHEISDDFLEIDEVKYWQYLPNPPQE